MLGGLLLCHKKDEKTVKILCDEMLTLMPGLRYNLKVNVSDCEKAIINSVCETFPNATLLICTRHIEQNFEAKFKKAPLNQIKTATKNCN